MMSEIGLEKPKNSDLKTRRSTIDERDKDQGINFERFCEIMGFDVNMNSFHSNHSINNGKNPNIMI
jgi:hypothetical protein